MDCGFLAENIILTLACVGAVAVCREIYLAILWHKIKALAQVIVVLNSGNKAMQASANTYVKWCVPQAKIKLSNGGEPCAGAGTRQN